MTTPSLRTSPGEDDWGRPASWFWEKGVRLTDDGPQGGGIAMGGMAQEQAAPNRRVAVLCVTHGQKDGAM